MGKNGGPFASARKACRHVYDALARDWDPISPLALLLVPTGLVEPLKLVAVAVAGDGHWITGTVMIGAAYAASLLLVDRLFVMVKPKLLTLPWFARLWRWFVAVRSKAVELFRRA
ncbi:hypothetical protein SAMN05443248_8034 [Bradyrhizobium erythrophlei]|uniref:Uncharacterized protein n=2 Tax=Bradyrhizobium erythrophlei TaxID=1437360 RepID=A0A1M5Y932_9BRAD|nr:hypothetical protein SAMN05443248_8034 [Bradyrhizobium erythrophlei]